MCNTKEIFHREMTIKCFCTDIKPFISSYSFYFLFLINSFFFWVVFSSVSFLFFTFDFFIYFIFLFTLFQLFFFSSSSAYIRYLLTNIYSSINDDNQNKITNGTGIAGNKLFSGFFCQKKKNEEKFDCTK